MLMFILQGVLFLYGLFSLFGGAIIGGASNDDDIMYRSYFEAFSKWKDTYINHTNYFGKVI